MDKKSIAVVLLAAGKGTRLKLDLPKPLAPLQNRTLIDFVLDATSGYSDMAIVLGYQHEKLESHLDGRNIKYKKVHQLEQLGTGHAVAQVMEQAPELVDSHPYLLIACADTPLLTSQFIEDFIGQLDGQDALCATFTASPPHSYGRIVRSKKGFSIVEDKDATKEQREAINEVNSGLYLVRSEYLKSVIGKLDQNNASNEFYLTDIFAPDQNVEAIHFNESRYFRGVNTLRELSEIEETLSMEQKKKLMNERGVRFTQVSTTTVMTDNMGSGVLIEGSVSIDEKTVIGNNVTISQGCVIKNSVISDGTVILPNTVIVDSSVGKNCKIGPSAHLRPGSKLGDEVKVGNFVELKKSTLADSVSVSHLSYVGDAEIGERTNIGCGFITCNYDGAAKHLTRIGSDCFIGSDTQMIAPVTVGDGCYVASGSTINKDMEPGDFAVARARQVTKPGMAKRFIKKKP